MRCHTRLGESELLNSLMKLFELSKDNAVPQLLAALLAQKEKLQAANKDQKYKLIDAMMTSIAKEHNLTGQQLHDAWVAKYKKIPDAWIMSA